MMEIFWNISKVKIVANEIMIKVHKMYTWVIIDAENYLLLSKHGKCIKNNIESTIL